MFLFECVKTLSDLGKLFATEFLNGALDFFDTAHIARLYRLPIPDLEGVAAG